MFKEYLGKSKRAVLIELERLGIKTHISPLTPDEIAECKSLGRVEGARYALYLACEDLQSEGLDLFKKGELFSPLDITKALDLPDIMEAYSIIMEISGHGVAKVRAVYDEALQKELSEDLHEAYDGDTVKPSLSLKNTDDELNTKSGAQYEKADISLRYSHKGQKEKEPQINGDAGFNENTDFEEDTGFNENIAEGGKDIFATGKNISWEKSEEYDSFASHFAKMLAVAAKSI